VNKHDGAHPFFGTEVTNYLKANYQGVCIDRTKWISCVAGYVTGHDPVELPVGSFEV